MMTIIHISTLISNNAMIMMLRISGIWELRIGMLRLADAGLYECQANTEPKVQFPINLIIEDTVAVISGENDIMIMMMI